MAADLPYRDLNSYLKGRFGERVQKITLDAGLTCPNRDGRVSTGGCLYCNARGSGTGAWGRGQSIPAQVETGIARLSRRYGAARFIAYFQSFSNTYAPLTTLRELYEAALAPPQVVGLASAPARTAWAMRSWTSWPATSGTGWYGWNSGCSRPMTRRWRASTGATTRPASARPRSGLRPGGWRWWPT